MEPNKRVQHVPSQPGKAYCTLTSMFSGVWHCSLVNFCCSQLVCLYFHDFHLWHTENLIVTYVYVYIRWWSLFFMTDYHVIKCPSKNAVITECNLIFHIFKLAFVWSGIHSCSNSVMATSWTRQIFHFLHSQISFVVFCNKIILHHRLTESFSCIDVTIHWKCHVIIAWTNHGLV